MELDGQEIIAENNPGGIEAGGNYIFLSKQYFKTIKFQIMVVARSNLVFPFLMH